MYSTSIIFDRKAQAKGDKEGTLEVRLTVNRKSYYISTGVRVLKKHWAGAVVNRPDADALNERLMIIVRRVASEVNNLLEERRPIEINVIKQRIFEGTNLPAPKDTLIEWVRKEVPLLNMTERTRDHYWLLVKRLEEFGRLNRWSDATVERIYEWDTFVRNITKPQRVADRQAGKPPKKISDTMVHNYHKYLKMMLSRAVRVGRLTQNPYERLKGEFNRGTKENTEFLTDEEMDAILSLRPMAGTPMCVARDLFVFQLYTGMSYADTQKFDISQYKKVNGVWVSNQERIKTGVAYVSHLLPPVIEVLERYGMQAPQIGNADYNHALKAIQLATGITTRLHSHLARHSFATFMLRNGVTLENLAKMMGHSTIRETQKYAKVTAQAVHDDFERISKLLTKTNGNEKD